MPKPRLVAFALLVLAGCGRVENKAKEAVVNANRDLQLAPMDTSAPIHDAPEAKPPAPAPEPAPTAAATPAPAPPAPKPEPKPEAKPAAVAPKPAPKPVVPSTVTVAAGAEVRAAANDTISSRHQKAGESFHATVGQDVKDAKGHVVIPAGSTVTFQIVVLEPAENKSQKDGRLELKATEVTIKGESHPISAAVTSVTHFLQGRGVTGGDVAKVGGATAGGAVVGGLIGKGKGAVIGGLLGAAAGTAVAVHSADRDVVIPAGGEIVIALLQPLTVPR